MEDKGKKCNGDDCLGLDEDMETYQFKHFVAILLGAGSLLAIIFWVAPHWFATVKDADSTGRYLVYACVRAVTGIVCMIMGTCLWDFVTPGHSVRETIKDPKASAIVIAAMMGGIAYIIR